jgi:hypothetical protein
MVRHFTIAVALVLALTTSLIAQSTDQSEKASANGSASSEISGTVNNLDAEELKVEMRASTREQEQFIDYIVLEVRLGHLSRKVVDSAYSYAMKKPRNSRFQYFQKVVFILADKVGTPITWPPKRLTNNPIAESKWSKYFSVLVRLIPWTTPTSAAQ